MLVRQILGKSQGSADNKEDDRDCQILENSIFLAKTAWLKPHRSETGGFLF